MEIQKQCDKFKEECGVFGIFTLKNLNLGEVCFYALNALQHRGEESCGVAISNGDNISCFKGMGLVSQVFNKLNIEDTKGISAIGHVRYSTFGESNLKNAQPICNSYTPMKIAIAHNGNITNGQNIREKLEELGSKFITSTDSEVILKLIVRHSEKGLKEAVESTMQIIKGGFAVVLLTENKLIGFRDPNGIRPLCIGMLQSSYVLASESCALDAVGAQFIRDVSPGEIVIIDKDGIASIPYKGQCRTNTCSFEYIYFARADSVIDDIDVYKSRVLVGEELFKECKVSADIVIGVPDSGIAAAIGYSRSSGISFENGFVKNSYIGRTFIAPTKEKREKDLAIKLSVIKKNIKGKRVVVVDDSIVRGTTSKKIVSLLRNAGAKEVHFMIASPVIKYPCYLGINTPNRKELLGADRDINEIKDFLGVDSVGYISIKGFIKAVGKENDICLQCFNGENI